MKIVFCIRSLEAAGAERQLVHLANGLARKGHAVSVGVLYPGGALEESLDDVELVAFHKKSRWDVSFLPAFIKYLRQERPDLIHGYLGLGNILSILGKPFVAGMKAVWGVRASNMDIGKYGAGAKVSYWLERNLSRFADAIIANSHAGMQHAIAHGYPQDCMYVVPNGIDVEQCQSASASDDDVRSKLGLGNENILFGMIGRVDIMKGHDLFLEAASRLAARYPQARFVCVGRDEGDYAQSMKALGERLPNLRGRIDWLQARNCLCSTYKAIDVLVSASRFGEGFSNVIGEAMANSVPCLVTDVGDSKQIIGQTGIVIRPDSVDDLHDGMERFIQHPDMQEGQEARQRIESEFSVSRLVSDSEALLQRICKVPVK